MSARRAAVDAPVIDAHTHLWDPTASSYEWLDEAPASLRRLFDAEELGARLEGCSIDGAILVQADNTPEDTAWLIDRPRRRPWVQGVVAWYDLRAPETIAQLGSGMGIPFAGFRHMPDDGDRLEWLVNAPTVAALRTLAASGLTMDIVHDCPQALRLASRLAARVPELTIVVDHLGRPPVESELLPAWIDDMRVASQSPNVAIKYSAIGAALGSATPVDTARAWLDVALETFGPDRVMWGSDWPVCTIYGSYDDHWELTLAVLDRHDDRTRRAVLGGTALSYYRLDDNA